MKVSQLEERFYHVRRWTLINYDLLKQRIIDSDEYQTMLEDDNLDRITINLIKLIQREYNNQAPIFKVKDKQKNNDILTKDTKKMIE